ncbi:Elongation factor P hydroxylase [Vibrio quintilis]|uniref:Elongation factor P hydroxylase n=2 Tax=Vibrio quintilis TaxID=1117707 RepID=A0A1M7YTB0_9VIBR|nr:Elongation factor P hydroxylase [Vibrio quintilis]
MNLSFAKQRPHSRAFLNEKMMKHDYQDLIRIFDQTFYESCQTRLESGDDEPIYLPADHQVNYHRIVFAHGFFASALHEIAHWCVAGPERRLLEDFGYWYEPDGRTEAMQQAFEQVEIRPQAYEWIFSECAGFPFSVSCDNLDGDFEPDRLGFMQKVHDEVLLILSSGLPARVRMFADALRDFYHTGALSPEQFNVK